MREPGVHASASTVLVTGAGGFVGTTLVRTLRGQGRPVFAGVRRAAPDAGERVLGDLGRTPAADLAAALAGIDAVVHLAGRAHVMRETAADPLAEFRRVNVDGTVRLAEAAVRAGVKRLVFVSSVKVNGERSGERPLHADDPPAPEDAYGLSKLEAERRLREIEASTGLAVAIVRPPLIYGPGVKGNLERLARLVARGVPLPLGRVANRRSLLGVDNLAELLARCIDHPAAAGGTFLASDDDDVSTPGLVRRLAAAMNKPARLVPVPVPVLALAARVAGRRDAFERLCGSLQVDIAATKARLDWTPSVSLDQGLRRMVRA
jgi:nucleoside-diphosphate-sugar epimerase